MAMKTIESSPQLYARSAGALYLAVIVLGILAEGFIAGKLIVSGDATATANNILAAPGLWNLGVAANLFIVLFATPQMWIEYQLLRPVSKDLSLLFVMLNAVSLAVEAVSKIFLLLVMPMLSNVSYQQAFDPPQLHAFAYMAVKAHNISFNVALIFFGMACLVNGYLIFKSGYFPKFIGVLMQAAGFSYLIACLSLFFAPTFATMISPAILLPALIGEASFCLWLLVKGVNISQWNARLAQNALVEK